MEEGITEGTLANSLAAALSICPPDEYQRRHNLLIRQLAAYVLKDYLKDEEGMEDP